MQTDKRKIILLDEIEKSHSTVMDAYMRMIDEGIARDSHGPVIVMVLNVL